MEFVGNSPDLKKALAHPVKPKRGSSRGIGNARGCRNIHEFCEATAADVAMRDRCAGKILKAAEPASAWTSWGRPAASRSRFAETIGCDHYIWARSCLYAAAAPRI